ncbi:MAG: DUF3857 domain-containing protein [Flavisolibacter sp.]
MRKLSLLLILLCSFSFAIAQKNKKTNPDLPPFGTVDKADLELKDCDFDQKAGALVLVDDGLLQLVYGSGIELKHRMRIKILNDKGLEWANVNLSYLSASGEQDIKGIEAQTYNLDDKGNIVITKVDKKLIYQKNINKKWSEKIFTFPEVKVGSIIEYRYKKTGEGLIPWQFQSSIPVRYSQFIVDFPTEIEAYTSAFCSREYESTEDQKADRVIKTYSMRKIPSFHDEPYIINEDFYHDRLETKILAYPVNGIRSSRIVSWKQVIKSMMEDEDFGIQIKKNIPRTAELDEKLKNINQPYEKMKTIYKYVQANMEWNNTYGIWALDGVKSAWKDKKGTVGEINLILVNLLKDAGLNASPLLVSTHDNGLVNTMDAGTYENPGFNQFNKCMAYVEINNKIYVLDATDKETPIHLIPADVLVTEGLVIEKIETGEWGWKLLWDNSMISKNVMFLNGIIDETGKMKGEVSISSFDYARLARAPLAKKGKEIFKESFITASTSSINVEDVEFQNLESDSLPLVQKVKFNQNLNSSGEYSYFSPNILTGLEKNPFVADNRLSDVFFGYNQSYDIIANFTLPEGFEMEELPKNVKLILPDTSISITRLSQLSGNILSTRIRLEFKKPVYPATQYDELHEFYKRLFDILNEQYVIRKKK